jgi:hypothetical protein
MPTSSFVRSTNICTHTFQMQTTLLHAKQQTNKTKRLTMNDIINVEQSLAGEHLKLGGF